MRNSTNPETKIAINQWFNATQSKILSIDEAISKLSNALNQLLTAKTTDRSSLIEGFASLSVSLAVHENNFGKTIGPIVSRLHTKLIEIIHHTLELNHNSSAQFMKIYGNISQIHGLYPISRLKQSEIDDYLAKILKRIIFSLNTIRTKEKLTKTNDTLEVISALNHLKGFFQVFPQNEISIREILELVIRNKVTKDQLNEYILKFAEKLLQIIPDQFSKLSDLHDMDDICDLVYDKSEIFSEEVNKILLLVKEKSKDNTIFADSLKTMLLNFSDVIILVMHSLIISGITFSPISATFTNCFSQLALDFGEFIEKTLSISNSSKDISPELRRINRKMTNQFDSLINIVENQEIYSLEANSEFEVIKNMLFANLSTLVVQVARLNALVSVALVPEMYKSHYKDIIQNINDITNQLKSSVSKVRSKAVGKTSTEIGSLMNELENKVNSVIQSTKKIDFNDIFPPKVLYLSVVDLCKVTLNMCKTGAALTDIVIIEPDKEAAGKVPGDYSVPQLPKVKSSPSEALQEINIAKRIVYKTTSNFKTLIETYSVASSELLDAIKSVRDATIKFIEKALIMAVVTVDSSSQVEQQTSIYSLVSALNDLQLATKNRLLRTPNFEQEMCDSIKMFDTTFEKCIKLADIASKIEIVVEDDSLDQVTKELNATSNAIELMTSKLKEFEEQVKRETEFQIEEESHIDVSNLEAASGTLAAYLISAANPIFSASAAIVRRAKDITNKLLLSNKKIENERGLIKAAQELSEASELIIICAESLVNGNEADAEYKVIAASRIIKATIAALVSQVLLKGGDPEGIMNKLVKEVSQNADSVISRSKAIVQEKLDQEENARPKKGNVMIRKLNMQQRINEQLKLLQQEERNLYQFRHK
ncbi:hypothetical protein GPJ56_003051 [Histomonas meleagridis]|uniref:uncharacterized protein n=1 Tax=Histomonas meleagridis TaxID=135588 RepID=UPI00355971E9|nr:hypothetical protein GPJ56_003051 [Histomonas meleagridis]KAH0805175.1 hypothetical protein GO595_002120 [Histomonas meleagridis]